MGRDWVFSPAHVPRAQKAPTPSPHPLHPTIARGAPLSSASKSWRQIAPTPIASWSVDPHDHQRAFRQALRQDLRCHSIRNTRVDAHGLEFSGRSLFPNCAAWRRAPSPNPYCLLSSLFFGRLAAERGTIDLARIRGSESQSGIRNFEYSVPLRHYDGDIRCHSRLQAEILIIDADHHVIGHHILHIDRCKTDLTDHAGKLMPWIRVDREGLLFPFGDSPNI